MNKFLIDNSKFTWTIVESVKKSQLTTSTNTLNVSNERTTNAPSDFKLAAVATFRKRQSGGFLFNVYQDSLQYQSFLRDNNSDSMSLWNTAALTGFENIFQERYFYIQNTSDYSQVKLVCNDAAYFEKIKPILFNLINTNGYLGIVKTDLNNGTSWIIKDFYITGYQFDKGVSNLTMNQVSINFTIETAHTNLNNRANLKVYFMYE